MFGMSTPVTQETRLQNVWMFTSASAIDSMFGRISTVYLEARTRYIGMSRSLPYLQTRTPLDTRLGW